MGRKGSWFSAVKKVLSPESKKKKDKKGHRSKGKWFGRHRSPESGHPVPPPVKAELPVPAVTAAVQEVKLTNVPNEQNEHAYSVALATAVAAEAAVAAAQAAAEVVRLAAMSRHSGKSREEIAAIKIQTAFRGYLARRALRALKGLVRLRSMIQGQSVQRQATATLHCMQTLARVQCQIRSRRLRVTEENQALQRQLQQKREKELEKLRASMGEDWNDSTQSKEQVEANLQSKQEAAMRRERGLAYAYSHQQMWRNTSKSANPELMDPKNPHWGWSWLERWMASRPWEIRSTPNGEPDQVSIKTATSHAISIGEVSKAYNSPQGLGLSNKPSSHPACHKSPSVPTSKARSAAARTRPGGGGGGEYDSRSSLSFHSERCRRHSIASSSVRDDDSLASSPAIPSYMAATESARARSKMLSPLGNATPEKGSTGSAKRRLSFQSSPTGQRRHSGPPKLEAGSIKDFNVHS